MPIGWLFTVQRPVTPVTPESWSPDPSNPSGVPDLEDAAAPIALWQSRVGGLEWLERLVAQERAIKFAQCAGYPFTYLARAVDVLPVLADPPAVNTPWVLDEGSLVDPGWGRGRYDGEAIAACPPQEWLLIIVWDES